MSDKYSFFGFEMFCKMIAHTNLEKLPQNHNDKFYLKLCKIGLSFFFKEEVV